MANEIELGNILHQTDVVSSIFTEAFVQEDNVLGLIATTPFPDVTNVIKVPKLGKVEAGAHAESAAYSYGADDEITDSSTTLTGTKKSQAQKITVENARFAAPYNTMERYTREAGKALNRLAASEFKALFSSVSTAVTATNTLTKDNLLDARYTVESAVKSGVSEILNCMISYGQMNDLDKALTDTAAAAFFNQVDLGPVLGIANGGRPRGRLFGIDIYVTSGLPTDSGDDVGCVWDPNKAFVAGIDPRGVNMRVKEPEAAEPWYELFFWAFWHIAEHEDSAAVRLRSDS